jgi:hypothetical protein
MAEAVEAVEVVVEAVEVVVEAAIRRRRPKRRDAGSSRHTHTCLAPIQ